MKPVIEKANQENLDEILNLFKSTIEVSCSKDYNKAQISAWTSSIENKERWIHKIKSQYFIVVKQQNKIIGFGSLENNYLDFLFVDSSFLRKGIATLIYTNLKEQSEKLGYKNLTTYSSKTAFPFFKSKGFKVVRENTIIRNDVEITNFEMTQ